MIALIQRYSLTLAASTLIVFLASAQQHTPSKERVDPTLRKRTEIDGNNVRTSVFNFCFSGRTGVGQGVPYEWPKNTGRVYVALIGLFAGGEVTLDNNSVARIVDLPSYRQKPGGADWNLNPLPGYFNQTTGKIAKSDEPDTWPTTWPDKAIDSLDPGWKGKWNGYFGKDQFSADQEMFYRVGDDNYDRWAYTPDTTDPTRKGLGLIIDSRAMEWSQASVSDAVFFIHAIKNDGTKTIKRMGTTLWLADFVGGDGDSQDDHPDFDLLDDIAFSFDADGISSNAAFNGVFVGAAATLYLETPGNAVDRIDNDGDGEAGIKVTQAMIQGEISGDGIDNNKNGLIDEDSTYIAFGTQVGVGFADGIDNNGNGEVGSPVVTSQMDTAAQTDQVLGFNWNRWPPNPESDAFAPNVIHLIDVNTSKIGQKFKDNIDNDGNSTGNWPVVTVSMVQQAASDLYRRYKVPGTSVILYDVDSSDIGKKYINIDGGRDAKIDEGIDDMIDESRDDGIDNDGDWNPLLDDVGLDGAAGTGDYGEGDGKLTSGAGTPFPGEPNTDKVDVSEADQIGLTNVQYLAAGAIDFSTTADFYFWANFLVPGSYVNPGLIPTGESDLFVSSGLFPLKPGQTERVSYAVVFGAAVRSGPATTSGAKDDALRKRDYAQLAYNEDYQFAQAPLEPKLTAVAGDKKVTLYWDDLAEKSKDRFLAGIPGAKADDFEGYKIYRATDPAFEDARVITDAFGSPAPFLKPIASFDLKDGLKGFHAVPYNGVQFDLGSDNGLVHSWVDTNVQNGQKYYYAIRAFDQGYEPLKISPAESNLKINIDNVTGRVKSIGTAVAIVTPEVAVAGYAAFDPRYPVSLVQGTTTGKIYYSVVDPDSVKGNRKFRITFEDTLVSGGANAPDTFKTKTYTLADISFLPSIDTLVRRSRKMLPTDEQPLVNGFRLDLRNETTFGLNPVLSTWSRPNVKSFTLQQWKGGFVIGIQKPSDYKIVFGSVGFDTSTQYRIRSGSGGIRPAIPVNFKVFNTSENKEIDFAFWEIDTVGSGVGRFSVNRQPNNVIETDIIVFLEKNANDSLVTTWATRLNFDSLKTLPQSGDTMKLVISKIFRSSDIFEFTTTGQHADNAIAATEMEKIKVVPNPYVAAATWEERNPFNTGRGPRSIHFTHLPAACTIRIFNMSGELVATIQHDNTQALRDGSAEWNLLTRDNLSAAYGIYIYHIDAPGVGEKIGKFAIIK